MFKSRILDQNSDLTNRVHEILQLKDIVARYKLLTELYLTQAETMLTDIACIENDNSKDEKVDSINELLDLSATGCDLMVQINDLYNDTGLTNIEVDDLISPANIQNLRNKNTNLTNTLLSRIAAPPLTPWVDSYEVQFGLFGKPLHVAPAAPAQISKTLSNNN